MFDDDFHIRPERVDERLTNLAGENVNGPDTPTRKITEDIQAEFLEATRPRPIVSRPSDTVTPQPGNDQLENLSLLILSTRVHASSDLPLDVFLEIASEVSPLDLIHLSRTSKTLRRLLMSKKNSMVWRDALSEVPELPPCPSDMAEPLYAALVFGQNCFGCGASDASWVDYALRLRMCERCYKANVVVGMQVFKSIPQHYRKMICDVILMLVPSANTFDFSDPVPSFDPINPLSHHVDDFYFKPELEAMLHLFWPLPAPENIAALRSLVRARVNYLITRQGHAILLHAWDKYCLSPAEGEWGFNDIKSSLTSPEFSELRGRDWDESTLYSDPVFTAYLSGKDDTPELDPDEPKPKPKKQLSLERHAFERREEVERAARLRARVAQVAVWNAEVMKLPALVDIWSVQLPNAYDNSRLWDSYVLSGHAREPFDVLHGLGVTEYDPGELRGRVAQSLAEYPGKVMRSLAEDVERFEAEHGGGAPSKGVARGRGGKHEKGTRSKQDNGRVGEAKQDPKDVLLRPTALFQCAECGIGALPYPEINFHWQKKHQKKSVWRGDCTETVYGAKVWEDGVKLGQRILAVLVRLGLPRNKRSMPWLDQLVKQGQVFCACGDPDMVAPEELSWADLVSHVFSHLHDNALRTKTATSSRKSKASATNATVWLNDHDLASCIKYLPDGADTAEASKRVTADKSDRERIDALIGQCTETSSLACHLCDAFTPDSRKGDTLFLAERADAVVYHMRSKHGKDFNEKDIACWDLSIFDKSPAP